MALGTAPLFPLVFLLKPIKSLFNQPELLGFFFLTTAAILYTGISFSQSRPKWPSLDPLLTGCAQAFAILPGVSRSGTTLTAARLLGWFPREAVIFSFLLTIPAILGGTVLEIAMLGKHPENAAASEWIPSLLGFLTSPLTGIFALKGLIWMATRDKLMPFVVYCSVLGIFTLYWFNG